MGATPACRRDTGIIKKSCRCQHHAGVPTVCALVRSLLLYTTLTNTLAQQDHQRMSVGGILIGRASMWCIKAILRTRQKKCSVYNHRTGGARARYAVMVLQAVRRTRLRLNNDTSLLTRVCRSSASNKNACSAIRTRH